MHFISFTVNMVGWTLLGLAIGYLALQGHRRKESSTVLLSSMSGLFGGSFSAMTHGMWVDVGIDFFNFFVALVFAIVAVYAFIPERREAVSGIFGRIANLASSAFSKTREATQRPNLGQNFGKNITSTLVPR